MCQLVKTSKQEVTPPTRKIQVSSPFELLCMDLLQFPKTSRGNVALLVCIDHLSKWLCAVPIKDKRASTVARALTENVLSKVPRLPDRILSDNGPEFRGEEFEKALRL